MRHPRPVIVSLSLFGFLFGVPSCPNPAFAEVERGLGSIMEKHGRHAVSVYIDNPTSHTMSVAQAHPGVNSNLLTDEEKMDPPSGTSVINGIPVRVEPVVETE